MNEQQIKRHTSIVQSASIQSQVWKTPGAVVLGALLYMGWAAEWFDVHRILLGFIYNAEKKLYFK